MQSLERFTAVIAEAKKKHIPVRGYISCAFGCPYEGKMAESRVINLAEKLFALGCYEISIGDTIGVATPLHAQHLFMKLSEKIPITCLAAHFHDTYGQALANILAVLEIGVATIDASVAGLGGCPYASGASGNVAAEDVLYMLNGLGIKTGVDMAKLVAAGQFIYNFLDKKSLSKVALAWSKK